MKIAAVINIAMILILTCRTGAFKMKKERNTAHRLYIPFIKAAEDLKMEHVSLLKKLIENNVRIFVDLAERFQDDSEGCFPISVKPIVDGLYQVSNAGIESLLREECRGLYRYGNEWMMEPDFYQEHAVALPGVDYDTPTQNDFIPMHNFYLLLYEYSSFKKKQHDELLLCQSGMHRELPPYMTRELQAMFDAMNEIQKNNCFSSKPAMIKCLEISFNELGYHITKEKIQQLYQVIEPDDAKMKNPKSSINRKHKKE